MPHTRYYSPNPIFSSIDEERVEELGIGKNNRVLIGYQTDPQHRSLCFITRSYTTLTSQELVDMHHQAYTIYQEAKANGMSEQDARAEIRARGFVNFDAWEDSELIAIPDDRRHLCSIVRSGQTPHKGKDLLTFDNSVGALVAHILTP